MIAFNLINKTFPTILIDSVGKLTFTDVVAKNKPFLVVENSTPLGFVKFKAPINQDELVKEKILTIINKEFIIVNEKAWIEEILIKLVSYQTPFIVVVNNKEEYTGVINFEDIKEHINENKPTVKENFNVLKVNFSAFKLTPADIINYLTEINVSDVWLNYSYDSESHSFNLNLKIISNKTRKLLNYLEKKEANYRVIYPDNHLKKDELNNKKQLLHYINI